MTFNFQSKLPRDPRAVSWLVYKKDEPGSPTVLVGRVTASNVVQANTKAKMMFGPGSWAVEIQHTQPA